MRVLLNDKKIIRLTLVHKLCQQCDGDFSSFVILSGPDAAKSGDLSGIAPFFSAGRTEFANDFDDSGNRCTGQILTPALQVRYFLSMLGGNGFADKALYRAAVD